jgi:endonuclease/exonuclease/phosphatase family metal-dependent hydrolase
VTLRVLSYNIRYGGRGREAAIAAVLGAAAPDVVVFQEATDPAVIERIAGLAGMSAWGARRGQSLGYASRVHPDDVSWHCRDPRATRSSSCFRQARDCACSACT